MTELGQSIAKCRSAFIGVGLFSALINLLMLTGPLYMLQVYDRVLLSRSMSTLVALSVLMAGLYAFMGLLEFIRSRVLVRAGNYVEQDLNERVFELWLKQGQYGKLGRNSRPLDNLNSVKSFMSGAAPGALFDLPWAPFFIGVIWILHWSLGLAALIGAIVIFILATLNEIGTKKALTQAQSKQNQTRMLAEHAFKSSDVISAMGMSGSILKKWQTLKNKGDVLHTSGSDRAGSYSATIKAFRMFLQSAILGLGCALAVKQIITPGGMIAASIIMGRALAPIQSAIGQWKGFIRARTAYGQLNKFLEHVPSEEERLELPDPKGQIDIQGVIATPPGSEKLILNNINFKLEPGEGLGVIGPSASGKSTLAKLLVGLWMPRKGSVRLDGATYDQWDNDKVGRHIGYLPQDVSLFDGTIKENISRLYEDATDEAIILAAKKANVHEMILKFPKGYETVVGAKNLVLSGGQIQRIALARALYGNPKLLVLDEPNANLDHEGDRALTSAIAGSMKSGTTVIVMTHRPSAIAAVNKLLMLTDGKVSEFGPKEDVLKKLQRGAGSANTPATISRQSGKAPNIQTAS